MAQSTLTDLASLTTRLRDAAESLGPIAHCSEWYLFGSASHETLNVRSDIDLLIIYDAATEHALELLQALNQVPLPEPLDLLILSRKEADEEQFVARQCAIQVWPPR